MTPSADWATELDVLLERLIEGGFTADDRARLNAVLSQGDGPRRYYRGYMRLHYGLEWRIGEPSFRHSFSLPPKRPSLGFLGGAWNGAIGYLSDHPMVLSNLVATVVLGMAIAAAALIPVGSHSSRHESQNNVARNTLSPSGTQGTTGVSEPKIVSIARITGMVDCVWVDTDNAPVHDRVVRGAKFMLKSGLMEITYYTGARVILQGPCTYEVESTAGGYLSLGKLTARVEKKAEVIAKTEVPRPKTQAPLSSSPFPLPPSPLFAIRTPTALVTDLGTEFGVEVGERGNRVEVFQGKVLVGLTASSIMTSREIPLSQGEALRIDPKGGVTQSPILNSSGSKNSIGFARAMPKLQTVPVKNPSFEEPALAIGEILFFDATAKSAWKKTGTGGAGIHRINGAMLWEPAGLQMAFINWDNSGAIYQTLNVRVGDYSTLLLTVCAGVRLDEDVEPNVEIAVQLYAAESDKLLGEVRQRISQKGMWYRLELRCNPAAEISRDDHLKIVLRRTDGQHQVIFDDVKMIGVPRPECKQGIRD